MRKNSLCLFVTAFTLLMSTTLYAEDAPKSQPSVTVTYEYTLIKDGESVNTSTEVYHLDGKDHGVIMTGICAPHGCPLPPSEATPEILMSEGDKTPTNVYLILIPTFTDTGVYLTGALSRFGDDGKFISRIPIRRFFSKDGEMKWTVELPGNAQMKTRAYKIKLGVSDIKLK